MINQPIRMDNISKYELMKDMKLPATVMTCRLELYVGENIDLCFFYKAGD